MKNISTVVLLLILAGCATQPLPTTSAQMVPAKQILNPDLVKQVEGKAEVIVKRDSGLRGSACAIRIFSGAQPIADLWQSEKIAFYLPEGDHIISASTCNGGLVEIQASVKVGKTSTYRVGFGLAFELGIYPTAF